MLAEAPWCVRINFNITIQSLIRHKNFQNYAHSCKQDLRIQLYERWGILMYHIIINPASRSGRGAKIWAEQVEPVLKAGNTEYQTYFSGKAGEVRQLAAQITAEHAAEPDLTLIVLGGDGTINETLQGIADPSKVILGYIPTGSSNDLARDLGISKDPKAALNLILHNNTPRAMDLGRLTYLDEDQPEESRLFAVSCGIGFDAAVCAEAMSSRIKDTMNRIGLGKLTYLGIALKQLITARKVSCTLTLEDKVHDKKESVELPRFLFVTCMSHRYEGGGFMFCPPAVDHDGVLDLCSVGNISKGLVLLALPTAFFGKHYFVKGINAHTATQMSITASAPLWVHTDGEVTRKSRGFRVECLPGAIRMITP